MQYLQGGAALKALLARCAAALVLGLICQQANALPKHAPVPGGVAVIDLGQATTAPTARWGEQPLAVVRDKGS